MAPVASRTTVTLSPGSGNKAPTDGARPTGKTPAVVSYSKRSGDWHHAFDCRGPCKAGLTFELSVVVRWGMVHGIFVKYETSMAENAVVREVISSALSTDVGHARLKSFDVSRRRRESNCTLALGFYLGPNALAEIGEIVQG